MDFEGFLLKIEGFGDGEKNTAVEFRDFMKILLQSIHMPGDIKIVNCTEAERLADYTSTGLGRGKREGWAICNGLNGTEPMEGLVPVGYGDGYPLNATGGEKLHKLTVQEMPRHRHTISNRSNSHNGSSKVTEGGDSQEGTAPVTDYEGGDQAHNNMQPYRVFLFIQKL